MQNTRSCAEAAAPVVQWWTGNHRRLTLDVPLKFAVITARACFFFGAEIFPPGRRLLLTKKTLVDDGVFIILVLVLVLLPVII